MMLPSRRSRDTTNLWDWNFRPELRIRWGQKDIQRFDVFVEDESTVLVITLEFIVAVIVAIIRHFAVV